MATPPADSPLASDTSLFIFKSTYIYILLILGVILDDEFGFLPIFIDDQLVVRILDDEFGILPIFIDDGLLVRILGESTRLQQMVLWVCLCPIMVEIQRY